MPKTADNFTCTICNFKCSKQSNWNNHILTAKHKNRTNRTEKQPKNAEIFECECGKVYKARNSLWYHKQKCTYVDDDDNDNDNDNDNDDNNIYGREIEPTSDANTVLLLLKQNQEFKTLMVEQYEKNQELQQQLVDAVKNNKGSITNNNTTNNNNQRFNLNFFLNDTCKDAMNITDFLGNMDVNVDELEYIGHHGYVNGMTKMIMDRLKGMDVTKRPIHCTDVKRETLYIKDQDEWNKDDSTEKLENAIQEVSRKSMQSLLEWKQTNPDYDDLDSEFSKKCIPMQRNSSALCKKESFYPKIINILAKENSISQIKK